MGFPVLIKVVFFFTFPAQRSLAWVLGLVALSIATALIVLLFVFRRR